MHEEDLSVTATNKIVSIYYTPLTLFIVITAVTTFGVTENGNKPS